MKRRTIAERRRSSGIVARRCHFTVLGQKRFSKKLQRIVVAGASIESRNTVTNQGRGEEVWAFDAETGMLTLPPPGTPALAQWQVPAWVRQGLSWQFSGSQTLDVGIPPVTSLPLTSSTRVVRVGDLWSEHAQQIFLYGQDAGSTVTATGPTQLFGGYWLPQEAIAVLKTGMVLDQDPLTGIQTSVREANRRRIVLEAAGEGHLTQLYYSATNGRLTGIYLEQQTMSGALYTTLEAVE